MIKIVLASTSLRRKEILSLMRLPFEVQESNYEEDMTLNMPPDELVMFLSQGKANAVAEQNPNSIIIAADTFVVFEHHRLGKPKNAERARDMLQMLSGKEHQIVTGVTIIDTQTKKMKSFCDTTKLQMSVLSPETIDAYINTGEPLDKAGGYAVQGIGALLIERMEGDFYSAVGLPIKRLTEELKAFDIMVLG